MRHTFETIVSLGVNHHHFNVVENSPNSLQRSHCSHPLIHQNHKKKNVKAQKFLNPCWVCSLCELQMNLFIFNSPPLTYLSCRRLHSLPPPTPPGRSRHWGGEGRALCAAAHLCFVCLAKTRILLWMHSQLTITWLPVQSQGCWFYTHTQSTHPQC